MISGMTGFGACYKSSLFVLYMGDGILNFKR